MSPFLTSSAIFLMSATSGSANALVASKGGAPEDPTWYRNLVANPHVELQDGTLRREYDARQVSGAERDEWWARSVAAYPPYTEYQQRTDRQIPVFVLEPREDGRE